MADFARVRRVFTEAAQRPPEQRETFLEQACDGDDELLAEVRELLACSTDGDDRFLDPPSGDAIAALLGDSTRDLTAGTQIGPYRIERAIASGGMGIVYEATRERPRRRVALKVLALYIDGTQALRRFQHEAEILANLRHPAIATVYETGLHEIGDRVVPWFAMELVEDAKSIVDYADTADLPLHERLQLFSEVCDAVHHGHLRGIIHRDLKPDNILVDSGGHPRVIDFGVAKSTDSDLALSTLRTAPGAIVGTLATMSPEQLSGNRERLDLRTDVYSLGVVLYRLLTGRLPYELDGVPLAEAARRIRETPPPRPSTLVHRLRGDLETILLEALEPEPERRYASAAALRDDLRRFIAGEPITARPPSVLYQVRVFARRHRALTVSFAAIVTISVAATIVSAKFGFDALAAEKDAVRRFEIVRDVGHELLYDVLDEMDSLAGGTQARSKVAATATRYLAALENEVGDDDPELLRDVFEGYARLGAFLGDPDSASLGAASQAADCYRRSLDFGARYERARPGDKSTSVRMLALQLDLGSLEVRLGDTAAGAARFTEVLAEANRIAAPSIRASALVKLGDAAEVRGAYDDAREHFETARAIYAARGERDLDQLAIVESRLGGLALASNDLEAAERHYAAVSEHATTDRDRANAFAELANLAERRGDADSMHDHAERAVGLARALVSSDPNDASARRKLGWTLEIRGVAERMKRDFESAHTTFDDAATQLEWARDRDPADLGLRTHAAEVRVKAAGTLLPLERAADSVAMSKSALDDLEAVLAIDPDAHQRVRPLCQALSIHSRAMMANGETDAVVPVLARFLELAEREAARAPRDVLAQRQVLLVHDRIGGLQSRIGADESRPVDARIAAYERAVEAYANCLAQYETMRNADLVYRGDERIVPHIERSKRRCQQTLEALR